ncbi:hypothetical protein [Fimbriimonas ginsengisoli]|nr:hypothetical protein [Fimbriimonas ginsengisoli]
MPRKKLEKPAETTPEPTPPAAPEPKKAKSSPRPAKAVAAKTKKPAAVVAPPEPEVVQVAEAISEPMPVKPAKVAPSRRGRSSPKSASSPIVAEPEVNTPEVLAEVAAEVALPEESAPISVSAEVEPSSAKGPLRNRGRAKAKPVVAAPIPMPEPVAVVETPVEEPSESAPTKGARGRRGRGAKTPTSAPVSAPAPEPAVAKAAEPVRPENYDFASLELPEPIWRPRQTTTPKAEAVDDEAASDEFTEPTEESGDASRRRRRRRRGRNGQQEEVAETPVAAAPAPDIATPAPAPVEVVAKDRRRGRNRPERGSEPVATAPSEEAPTTTIAPREPSAVRRDRPTVKPPEKAAIPIPDDAPQVVVRNGVPTLVRNHQVYPPIMFFGSPSDERRADTVLEEVRMAAEAGVHLHSYLVELETDLAAVDDSARFAAYILARSVQIDPESQVIFRLVLQAPRNWEDTFTNARYKQPDGTIAEPSICDDEYWNVTKACLERFVKQMRLLDLNAHILGVHLERGEWFLGEGAGYDDSKAAQTKFREWARTRYLDDEVTLRASWFDGTVRFDNIQIPPYQPEGEDGERFIRSSRRQRRYVDYHLFLSDATVQRIADLAYAAKAASDGYFLIGASYGYTFEWSHPASGHLSLGKLLRTPEIDFIAGPPSYRSRQPGGSAPFPGPIDSFALNGKLYISEEDFKTSLSVGHEPDDFNPQLKTPQALESVHWRGAGAALAHASGVAWMDLWGNGWLRTHSVWQRARKVREAMIDRLAAPLDDPEVAIFIDERALAYLVDSHAFKLLVQNVRESVLRAGVSAAFYLLSDLAHREKFPESKLYIFVNAWDVRPELRAAIKSRLQRDNKVLFWLYAAGLFDAGRESLERAREVTGIALKPQPFYSKAGTTILNRRHPLAEAFPDRNVAGGSKLEPSYFAIPEGATVLGEYTQTGLPSFVVKEFNEGPADTHWTSVFLGEPVVNPALIRALAQMAGAHVWNHQEDVVHVRHPFCTVHCQGAGPRTIMLPGKFSAYNLLSDEWSAVDSPNVRFTAVDGSTHCFLVGPRDELEHQLHADPRTVLHIEKLPPRETNMRIDSSNFDVPIMKLDEWMGGSDSDDNADEWFLRPQHIEEDRPGPAEESDSGVGRRRRRRRGKGNGQDGNGSAPTPSRRSESTVEVSSDFDDIGLNVMFRKRE